jgi:hypothetical protein
VAQVSPSAAGPATFLYDLPAAAVASLAGQGSSTPQQATVPIAPGGAQGVWHKFDLSPFSPLEEDDPQHLFRGCPVLVNDRVVAVLHRDTPAVDLYWRHYAELRLRAQLQPLCQPEDRSGPLRRDGPEGAARESDRVTVRPCPLLPLESLVVKENTQSSVAVEVGFHNRDGRPCRIRYELGAGTPLLKTTAGAGVERLRVSAACRFAVLPDFFADDMLIDAAAMPGGRAELPSENFLLHMLPGGETVLMTVSESRDEAIEIGLAGSAPRQIAYSDIPYGKKRHVWVALLAGKGIWHEHTIALADAGKEIPLPWQMPFQALWRVDWATADKMTESWEMLLQQSDGKYVMQGWFGQDESQGQRFGKEFGDRDWNKPGRLRWNPVLGGFAFPCWVDHDGRGYLQPLKARRNTEGGPVYNFAGPAILYPFDRAQHAPFRTPLDRLTVVDVVRLSLGVGPCQYILDLEGQKRNSRGVATCYGRDVINAIYKAGNQLHERQVIEEHLDLTVAFITNVRERIDQYLRFGREMAAYLADQRRRDPRHAPFIDELLAVNARLEQYFEAARERIRTPAEARQAADEFRQKLLSATGADAYEKCAAQMAKFTAIGGAQDGLVASCRMIVKTLRQRSAMALAADPELKALATEIRARTQVMLRNPTPYEAPRH